MAGMCILLGNNAGRLYSTAFPTWAGHSIISGHVWNGRYHARRLCQSEGMQYGDQIKVHAFRQVYMYEVRENRHRMAHS